MSSLLMRGLAPVSIMLMIGCAASTTVALKESLTRESLTQDAFQRAERSIRETVPGQPIRKSPLKWSIREIKEGKRVVGLLSTADGWAGELSGGAAGAVNGVGAVVSYEMGILSGRHVYGFIDERAIFIPQYVVSTAAEVISEEEYRTLSSAGDADAGWAFKPGERDIRIYFRNPRIDAVRPVDASSSTLEGVRADAPLPGSLRDVRDAVAKLYGKEHYASAKERLRDLQPGADEFSVIKGLGGFIAGNYGGASFVYFIKGYLNFTGEYRLAKMSSQAIYHVWPFGYVENGKEVPLQALVFRNGLVDKVIPYESREQVLSELP
jgi:hypothetical protein